MDKRIFLAVILTIGVIFTSQYLFPPVPVDPAAGSMAGQVAAPPGAVATPSPAAAGALNPALGSGVTGAGAGIGAADSLAAAVPAVPAVRAETLTVATPLTTYQFANVGAAPVSIELQRYRSLREGARAASTGNVELVRPTEALFGYAVAIPGDTIDFSRVVFDEAETRAADGTPVLTFRGVREGIQLALTYAFQPDSYLVRVSAAASGLPSGPSFLLLDLPQGIPSAETDSLEDQGHLAYAYKVAGDNAKSINFGKLDPGERRIEPGPHSWVATKNKYFIVGVLGVEGAAPFAELNTVGGVREGKRTTRAAGTVLIPFGTAPVTFEVYAGPQEWRRLVALGRDFKDSNPYGGFMQGIVQPFATIVMNVLLWMRSTLDLSYGWVLVIFGVVIRLLMWPLNQKAMRTQLAMQQLQPELQAAQKRYAKEPQKQQQEIMRIYKEHNMSPFSTLSGCLPMLLPMPIFFALFFVFQNTIEFRGVPFLWLDDISLKDPYYILPLFMGATTFLVSWIGFRGQTEVSQQQKMIMYVIPLTFTFVLLNMASGLNLYYAVQNIAALPQQWLIARERMKVKSRTVVMGTPTKPPPASVTPTKAERRRKA